MRGLQGKGPPGKQMPKKRVKPGSDPVQHQLMKMSVGDRNIYALIDSEAPVSSEAWVRIPPLMIDVGDFQSAILYSLDTP